MINFVNMLSVTRDMEKIIYTVKLFFICIFTGYTFFKVANIEKKSKTKIITIILATGVISIICSEIKYRIDYFTSMLCLVMILAFMYTLVNKNDFIYNIICVIICISINYVIFFIAVILDYIPNVTILNAQNDYINLIIMLIIHFIILYNLFKIKKFKKGLNFLQAKNNDDYFSVLILNIGIIIIYSFIISKNITNSISLTYMAVGLMILSIVIFVTIKKTLNIYYKHKLLVKDLEETKTELSNAKEEISKLEQENLNFGKISHSIAHKQKILEHKINELNMNNEVSSEIDIKSELDEITNEYYKKIIMTELSKTDIEEIDDVLEYMKSECIKNNIMFELQLNQNINYMINHFVSKEELQILLADHIKDAIIAIQHSDNINRSILVRLGLIDGCYGVYIYDSGIEFEIDTLLNLGDKPITTHASEGGTGMGFLNTFDTIRKHNASLIINEIGKPCKDNYTKVIMIKFDQKNSFRIKSYRSEEIKKHDENKKLYIEE